MTPRRVLEKMATKMPTMTRMPPNERPATSEPFRSRPLLPICSFGKTPDFLLDPNV